jgi:DNA-binding CsgD family transcriptional regulator
VLDGLLSDRAAALLGRLTEGGGELAMDVARLTMESPEVVELLDLGVAWTPPGSEVLIRCLTPIEAIRQVLDIRQRDLLRTQAGVHDALRELTALSALREAGSELAGRDVVAVGGGSEVQRVAHTLKSQTRERYCAIDTHHVDAAASARHAALPPRPEVAEGADFQIVYSRASLELPFAHEMLAMCRERGEEARVLPHVPMRLVVSDGRKALVPLTTDPHPPALLIRSALVVSALQHYFDLLWATASPVVGENESTGVSPSELTVLRLLAAGLKDEAIARSMGVSVRTVRRQLSSLEKELGVRGRVPLAVAACRRGWLGEARVPVARGSIGARAGSTPSR